MCLNQSHTGDVHTTVGPISVCVDDVQQAKVTVTDILNSDLGHFVICRNKSDSNQIFALWKVKLE